MNWKNLFTPVKSLNASEAKELMDKLPSTGHQLLDVRQPKEYEAGHLANAVLIPLRELPDRLTELDRQKPTIVYCAVGGRSMAASQLLAGQGFDEIYNLSGGIKAWEGTKATGPEQHGFELLPAAADFDDAITLAYYMEHAQQQFYLSLADSRPAGAASELFTKLAAVEDIHKARLSELYRKENGADMVNRTGPPHPSTEDLSHMEGGVEVKDALHYTTRLEDLSDILDLAMMLETQALDLYGRLARRAENQQVKDLFLALADEEKIHLRYLADRLDSELPD